MCIFKIAKKIFGDKILAIFRSKKGVWGEPGFVVVRREAQNPNVPNRQKRPSREKKMKRPTTAGAACRPRSTARSYPRNPARRQLGNFCREGWGREELGGHDQHHPLAAKRCFKRPGMIRALKMMIRDEALALKLTPYLQVKVKVYSSRRQNGHI